MTLAAGLYWATESAEPDILDEDAGLTSARKSQRLTLRNAHGVVLLTLASMESRLAHTTSDSRVQASGGRRPSQRSTAGLRAGGRDPKARARLWVAQWSDAVQLRWRQTDPDFPLDQEVHQAQLPGPADLDETDDRFAGGLRKAREMAFLEAMDSEREAMLRGIGQILSEQPILADEDALDVHQIREDLGRLADGRRRAVFSSCSAAVLEVERMLEVSGEIQSPGSISPLA